MDTLDNATYVSLGEQAIRNVAGDSHYYHLCSIIGVVVFTRFARLGRTYFLTGLSLGSLTMANLLNRRWSTQRYQRIQTAAGTSRKVHYKGALLLNELAISSGCKPVFEQFPKDAANHLSADAIGQAKLDFEIPEDGLKANTRVRVGNLAIHALLLMMTVGYVFLIKRRLSR